MTLKIEVTVLVHLRVEIAVGDLTGAVMPLRDVVNGFVVQLEGCLRGDRVGTIVVKAFFGGLPRDSRKVWHHIFDTAILMKELIVGRGIVPMLPTFHIHHQHVTESVTITRTL